MTICVVPIRISPSIILLTVTRCTSRVASLKTYAATEDKEIEVQKKVAEYIKVPGLNEIIRPTVTDRARTITHVCTSGTLCTTSVMDEVQGSPFGSYVDYILDDSGWPVMLLSEQSLHTMNIKQSPQVSLFCQLPRSQSAQAAAALSRVTIVGTVEPIPAEQLSPIKLAFTLIHQYAEQIADSPKFSFCRIKPQKIYFSGGFGVMATWVDVLDYETARPDVLAAEVTTMLSRINLEKQGELLLLCKHFLNIEDVDLVRIQAIDRLGVDLRVKAGDYTDEYRCASFVDYLLAVVTASMMKLQSLRGGTLRFLISLLMPVLFYFYHITELVLETL